MGEGLEDKLGQRQAGNKALVSRKASSESVINQTWRNFCIEQNSRPAVPSPELLAGLLRHFRSSSRYAAVTGTAPRGASGCSQPFLLTEL